MHPTKQVKHFDFCSEFSFLSLEDYGYTVAAWSVLLTKYHLRTEMSISEMRKAYSKYGGEERCVGGVGGET